ncbi:MAG TPA: hypothetical protein VN915_06125 [Elusimicrobiota bacterium]|nr:hypothetical protein [Elusimicrobiota bacterium]
MRSKMLCLSIGLAFVAASRSAAEEAPTRDEQKLAATAADLDKDSTRADGDKRVEETLEARFHVGDARIDGLRSRKLGYGEIAIVLALAQKLPGGINDANVSKIMAERDGPPVMGWGRIAKKEGVSLGKVMSDVRRADDAVRRDRDERAGKERAEAAERPERAERAERVERQERTERPENPRH